jgi:hypothetical protein
MNTAYIGLRANPPATGPHLFEAGYGAAARKAGRRDLADRRAGAGSAHNRRRAIAPAPKGSPDDHSPGRRSERPTPPKQFCPLAVPSVGFVYSRFTPGTELSSTRRDGEYHVRIKRSRAAVVLDYCAAAFVLATLVFGPILGWLIFE